MALESPRGRDTRDVSFSQRLAAHRRLQNGLKTVC
jgi:hypothetical protein